MTLDPEKFIISPEELDRASRKARARDEARRKTAPTEIITNRPEATWTPEKIVPRKLFLSFEGLLISLNRAEEGRRGDPVSVEDLDRGLFYLDCSRDHFFNPTLDGPINNELEIFKARGRIIHEKLKTAILKAEAEGRVVWPLTNTRNFVELDSLLKRNGLAKIGVAGLQQKNENVNYVNSRRQAVDVPPLTKKMAGSEFEDAEDLNTLIKKQGLPLEAVD